MITQSARNWISYLADALINARTMPSWEAADYLTDNLFDASPNTKLLEAKVPHDAVAQFLQRIYGPIVEAAAREEGTEQTSRVQVFTDISLTSETTVLIVSVSEHTEASQLVLIDWVRAWDFVFPSAEAFNAWAETRYQQVRVALSREASNPPAISPTHPGSAKTDPCPLAPPGRPLFPSDLLSARFNAKDDDGIKQS